MWNVEFSTFDDFLYIQAHDLELFGDLLEHPKYTKTGINQRSDGLHLSKVSFDMKCGV